MSSIEETTVPVSIKVIWGAILSVFSSGLFIAAGYFSLQAEISKSNSNKEKKDLVQDIQIETGKLNVQQIEMDMRDIKKELQEKEDKPLK